MGSTLLRELTLPRTLRPLIESVMRTVLLAAVSMLTDTANQRCRGSLARASARV